MPDLADLARDEEFVSLTTFRRSGAPVSVPVWIAPGPDGRPLITTIAHSGKVKRARHDARVTLRPCDRRGAVDAGAPTVDATAEIVEDPEEVRRLRGSLRAKYGTRMKVTAVDDPNTTSAPPDNSEPRRVILRLTPR